MINNDGDKSLDEFQSMRCTLENNCMQEVNQVQYCFENRGIVDFNQDKEMGEDYFMEENFRPSNFYIPVLSDSINALGGSSPFGKVYTKTKNK